MAKESEDEEKGEVGVLSIGYLKFYEFIRV